VIGSVGDSSERNDPLGSPLYVAGSGACGNCRILASDLLHEHIGYAPGVFSQRETPAEVDNWAVCVWSFTRSVCTAFNVFSRCETN